MRPGTGRLLVGLAAAAVVASVLAAVADHEPAEAAGFAVASVAVALGALVRRRRPTSAVGPALAWCAAAPCVVTFAPHVPVVDHVAVGLWPLNLAGLVLLLTVFPHGHRVGRSARWAPWLLLAGTCGTVVALWDARQVDGVVVGAPEGDGPAAAGGLGILCTAVAVGLAIAAVTRTYRADTELGRLQVRWLLLAGVVVGVLLVGGWAAELLGAGIEVAYTPFVVAVVLLVPMAVAAAILRHDLFDVDRVLSETVAVVLTAVVSAAVFAGTVLVASSALGATGQVTPATAAFVTALVLLPLHRQVARAVGAVVDRDRHVAVAAVQRFTEDVSAGRRQPEEVEQVLRSSQRDPALTLVLRHVDGSWADVDGRPAPSRPGLAITSAGEEIARLCLGHDTARARRRASALAAAAWLPIEVSRLRLGLRGALAEVEASRARFAEAVVAERRRLERDLHDGAQQRIVATGMRLRRLQRHLDDDQAAEVDGAVTDLEDTVRELRSLAHGVRPARLDDGLGPALESVRAASPVPVTLSVDELPPVDETRLVTAYLVVSEAVTNVLKHARAGRIDVEVAAAGDRIAIAVRDDGVGGAPPTGTTALLDRVASVGGELSVESLPGRGTTVRAVV